jgi:hypothetical protein
MSAEFVLAADDVKGCTVPKAEGSGRRLGYSSASCFIFQGMATFACSGKSDWDRYSKYGQNSNVAKSKQDYAKDPHTSMLFGKFDFSTFGSSVYGSLATPSGGGDTDGGGPAKSPPPPPPPMLPPPPARRRHAQRRWRR